MKIRESGMPDESMWETFFNPQYILRELGLEASSGNVVDLGCGYGTFTITAAQITTGNVFAFDIESTMISVTTKKVEQAGLKNVRIYERDFIANGTGLPENSTGFVMLFNILHGEDPLSLLRESFRILCPGGKLGIIHWNYDPNTPRGPSMDIRPKPEQCRTWAKIVGFELVKPHIDFPPYHYGIVARKTHRLTTTEQEDKDETRNHYLFC